ILYRSPALIIGAFDCPRRHPAFHDSGPAGGDLVVFPRHAVYIKHPNRQPILADQRVVTLYNRKQHYRREAVAEYGDYSVWFHFPRARLIAAMESGGWTHAALERTPFLDPFGRIDNPGFLRQRLLHEYLLNPREHDALLVEETALLLLADLLRTQSQNPRVTSSPSVTVRRQRDQVAHCLDIISRRWDQNLKLDALAKEVACSPFHLARIFKKHTGQTIHQCLLELRLRNSLDEMFESPARRLTDLSLDSGFATPSHFTQQFRRAFGSSPDRIRRSGRRPNAWRSLMTATSSAQ
ncbi:MAG: helix-turn-helix domain-containing protein, partial [Wenzhouxiangellaceae bacterium]